MSLLFLISSASALILPPLLKSEGEAVRNGGRVGHKTSLGMRLHEMKEKEFELLAKTFEDEAIGRPDYYYRYYYY